MPRITGLSAARRRGWLVLELDGEPGDAVPEATLIAFGLRAGVELDRATLDSVRLAAARAAAMDTAVHCLAYRPRSRAELIRHLRRKGHAEPALSETILRCGQLGYIDDRGFAVSFVRDRIRLRPRGRVRLRAELLAKGVSAEDAEAAIEQAFDEMRISEVDLLRRVASRRAGGLVDLERETARRRLSGYLLRRGFSRADVRATVDELLPGAEAS